MTPCLVACFKESFSEVAGSSDALMEKNQIEGNSLKAFSIWTAFDFTEVGCYNPKF